MFQGFNVWGEALSKPFSKDYSMILPRRCSGTPNDKLLQILGKENFSVAHYDTPSNWAVFVKSEIYEIFKLYLVDNYGIVISNEYVWDYELRLGQTKYAMKLVWILEVEPEKHQIFCCLNFMRANILAWGHKLRKFVTLIGPALNLLSLGFSVTNAFSFLHPDYLKYLDKPFRNRDAITQVNLVLDYHRLMKKRNVEIFNLVDLIAFKMAIDDNRLEYENCEFHKVIDCLLDEIIENNKFKPQGRINSLYTYISQFYVYIFDFNAYCERNGLFKVPNQIFEYLLYHFQDKFQKIVYDTHSPNVIVKLSTIKSLPKLFSLLYERPYVVKVKEIDKSGTCSETLRQILTSYNLIQNLKIDFVLDCDWTYTNHNVIGNSFPEICKCHISISCRNTAHFIENFINWMKLSFGNRCENIDLTLKHFDYLHPHIFYGLNIGTLHIAYAELNHKLIKILNHCSYKQLTFNSCQLENDPRERIDYLGYTPGNNRNVFDWLDCLKNAESIKLSNQEHSLSTMWKYVSCAMDEKNLKEFRFQNNIEIGKVSLKDFKFGYNLELRRIEMIPEKNEQCIDEIMDFLEKFINPLSENDSRDDFDFYS